MLRHWLQRYREWQQDRALLSLDAVHQPPTGRQWTKDHLGRLGEELATRYLQQQGCKPLRRNYADPEGGEADIVLRDREALVFAEVKTRSQVSDSHRPRDAVDRKKRDLIRRASRSWRRLLPQQVSYRYDIVEVLLIPGERPQITWLKDAFQEQG